MAELSLTQDFLICNANGQLCIQKNKLEFIFPLCMPCVNTPFRVSAEIRGAFLYWQG